MPSATAITLTDAASADHIYAPQGQESGVASFNDDSATTSAGRSKLTLGLSRSSNRRRTDHVNVKITFPFEHTVDGVVRVSHAALFKGSFILPEEMSDTDRDNVKAQVNSLLGSAIVTSYVKDLEPAY